nr:hypothetical protein CFP56_75189 [Quercus suber]
MFNSLHEAHTSTEHLWSDRGQMERQHAASLDGHIGIYESHTLNLSQDRVEHVKAMRLPGRPRYERLSACSDKGPIFNMPCGIVCSVGALRRESDRYNFRSGAALCLSLSGLPTHGPDRHEKTTEALQW